MGTSIHNKGNAIAVAIAVIALVMIAAAVIWSVQKPNRALPDAATRGVSEPVGDREADGALQKNDEGASFDQIIEGNDAVADVEVGLMQKDEAAPEETMIKPMVSGYADYTPEAYADAGAQRRILFFHAAWCPTCKAANQELSAGANQLPDDVIVFKTDYDTQRELKRTYGVTYQHTFVQVDSQGGVVTKWNGGGLNAILANLR